MVFFREKLIKIGLYDVIHFDRNYFFTKRNDEILQCIRTFEWHIELLGWAVFFGYANNCQLIFFGSVR